MTGKESEEEEKKTLLKSEVVIETRADGLRREPAPQPSEFEIYEDKAIRGWLSKQAKGYFTSKWK